MRTAQPLDLSHARSIANRVLPVLVMLVSLLGRTSWVQAQSGTVEFDVIEVVPGKVDILGRPEDGPPLASRVRLLDARGRPLKIRGGSFQSGWNLVQSPWKFRGRTGQYTFEVTHGPQFAKGRGGFTLDRNSVANDVLRLKRYSNLEEESWVGGDLSVRIPAEKAIGWLAAEDLAMAVSTVGNSQLEAALAAQEGQQAMEPIYGERSEWVETRSYADSQACPGLAFHHWLPPAQVPQDIPSSRLLVMAHEQPVAEDGLPVHVEVQSLLEAEVPIWLASGHVDSIQLLGHHTTIDGKAPIIKPALDPEPGRFRGEQGLGRLTEYLYWQVLETGLRIPPTAGSGFGKTSSPLGYNRVYAFVPSESRQEWWHAVRQGHSFVTNGPLLRAKANGQPPGAVFQAEEGNVVQLNLEVILTVSDPVDYLDVIFNGKKLYEARLNEYAKQGGRIPTLKVEESGWLVVRVVTGVGDTYRIASTAPFYCEVGERPRISRKSCQLFQDWLEIAEEQLAKRPAAKAQQVYLKAAKKFWEQRLAESTVD